MTRDIDLFQRAGDIEVGLSVTTADDNVRKLYEPNAPAIPARLDALQTLHDAGISTFAMIAPLLPGAGSLAEALTGRVDRVLADCINYRYADYIYQRHGLEHAMTEDFYHRMVADLAESFRESGIAFQSV